MISGMICQKHSPNGSGDYPPLCPAEVTWILEHHGISDGLLYRQIGLNKDDLTLSRHKWFDSAENFAEHGISLDPAYASKPLSYFTPMVEEIFSRPAFSPAIIGEPESQTE